MIQPRKTLVVATALAASLAAAATAQARTEWFNERQVIPTGTVVALPTASAQALTLKVKEPRQPEIKLECTASGEEAWWNTPEGGRGETRRMQFACAAASCGSPTVSAAGLPWHTALLGAAPPPRSGPALWEQWSNMALEVSCGGKRYGAFAGAVEAKVGDVDPSTETGTDDLDHFVMFDGVESHGHLEQPSAAFVGITGLYRLGTAKDRGITDESGALK